MPARACLLICLCIILLLNAPAALAGKLYKWVDENGVTHFGAIPPPQQAQKSAGAVEELAVPGSDQKNSSPTNRIRGVWWAGKDTRVTRQLKLSYDNFEIADTFVGGQGVTKKMIASGNFKLTKDMLSLTYFEQHENPAERDKTVQFEVTYLDDSKMILLQDFVHEQVYKRQIESGSTDFSRELSGEWTDPRGLRYKFDHGTFLIYSAHNKNIRQLGNWQWQDPELTLEFVADYLHPIDNKTGRMHRWIIQQRSYQEITFIDQSTGNKRTLKRIK
jgi:hypothetical protein